MLDVRRITSSILLATVAATLAVGCATDDLEVSASEPAVDLWLDGREVAGEHGLLTEIAIPGDEPVMIEGSICACETAECREEFVHDNLGDGICATFRCGDERVGACSPAEGPRDDSAGSDGAAAAPSTLAPPLASSVTALGSDCSRARTCDGGLTCMAGGMSPHKQSWSCELSCASDRTECPSGTMCVTLSDGPGRVCRPRR